MRQRIAVFGGTFDPVHNGHINLSLNVQKTFHFDDYYFLPCNKPVLKSATYANNAHRVKMLQLAIKNLDNFHLDLREINSSSPSYTIKSLSSIREEYPKAAITLILGMDAFISLPLWYQWERLIDVAHIMVMHRLNFSNLNLSEPLQAFLQKYQTQNKTNLFTSTSGFIFLFKAGNYEISSTEIRNALKEQRSIKHKLPKEVYDYILENKLYQ